MTHSLVWREVLSEYGVCDVASAVLRDRYGLWGFLDLWRTNDAGFTSAELDGLSVILNVVTEALRRTQALAFTATEPSQSRLDGPVVMLLSPHLEVMAETEATIDCLRALLPTRDGRAPIPACAYNVAAQLVACERGVDPHPALARLQAGGGHLWTLRAARIAGAGASAERNVAVTIATASGEERTELFARTHAFSSREALAALMFGAGSLVAPPAAAEPRPNEGCPPPFEEMDRNEQLALAAAEGLPPEVVDEALAALDKNADEVLCFLFLPAGHNIIDNRSAHRAPD